VIDDTIVALATAPGAAERAAIRISGPAARAVAQRVFAPPLPAARAAVDGHVLWREHRIAALALVMVAPASFTGEDVVELHLPGSPLLVRLLLDTLLADGPARGVREALPGEFTARACRHGRLDLAQAEGLLLLLHAADERGRTAALQWLHGGLTAAVRALQARMQDALAAIEAGLDFGDDETGALAVDEWAAPLPALAADLAAMVAALPAAVPGGEVLLLGRANAGKSSLCNALLGRPTLLVDATPGTTRDLLAVEIEPGVVLWDAPGDLDAPAAWDAAAIAHRDRLAGRAGACVLVVDACAPRAPTAPAACVLPTLAIVWTKVDAAAALPPLPPALAERSAAGVPVLATSAVTGAGLEPLRALLAMAARGGTVDAGGPVRAALQAASAAVAAARSAVHAGPEVVAVELQTALAALDEVAGKHSPELVLDRIYGRFCLGK
jgi:tRNA modification GTPase